MKFRMVWKQKKVKGRVQSVSLARDKVLRKKVHRKFLQDFVVLFLQIPYDFDFESLNSRTTLFHANLRLKSFRLFMKKSSQKFAAGFLEKLFHLHYDYHQDCGEL